MGCFLSKVNSLRINCNFKCSWKFYYSIFTLNIKVCFEIFRYIQVVVMQWHKSVTVNATVVGSIPTRGIELLYFFIELYLFILSCSGNKAKFGVEFHHLTRFTSRSRKLIYVQQCIMFFFLLRQGIDLAIMVISGSSNCVTVESTFLIFKNLRFFMFD